MKTFFIKNISLQRFIVFAVLGFFLSSCKVFPAEPVPYVADCDFVMEENSNDYSICGADFSIYNRSEKDIRAFSIVFYLFDKDGEPASECQGRISFDVEQEVASGEKLELCLSLDKFMNFVPEEGLEVDYLYISKIIFMDDSVWEDPFGLLAFK